MWIFRIDFYEWDPLIIDSIASNVKIYIFFFNSKTRKKDGNSESNQSKSSRIVFLEFRKSAISTS